MTTSSLAAAPALLALSLCPWAMPQIGTPPCGPVLDPPPLIRVGDGTTSTGTFNGADESPFLCALGVLPQGGQIEVLPGTYVFDETVGVAAAGVRIYGSRGARIRTGGGLVGPLFDAAAAATGLALDGLELVEARASAHPLVRIAAADACLRDCGFRILRPSTATAHVLEFLGTPGNPVSGPQVSGCAFVFAQDSSGRVGLRAEHCRGLRVIGCTFSREAVGAPALVQGAISLQESDDTAIAGCTFHHLKAPLTGAGAIVQGEATAPVVGRVALTGCYFEQVVGSSIVDLRGAGRSVIVANAFGRTGSPCGTIRLADGTGNAVTGNQFHNGPTGVRAEGENALLVADNTFTLCKTVQISLDAGSVGSVVGNLFNGVLGAVDPPPPAIAIGGTLGCAAVANTARGGFGAVLSGAPEVDDNNTKF